MTTLNRWRYILTTLQLSVLLNNVTSTFLQRLEVVCRVHPRSPSKHRGGHRPCLVKTSASYLTVSQSQSQFNNITIPTSLHHRHVQCTCTRYLHTWKLITGSAQSSSSSRMRVMNHNWSATKQSLHLQSVAEISRHSVLSGDRIRQCGTPSGSRHKDTDQCLSVHGVCWKQNLRQHSH